MSLTKSIWRAMYCTIGSTVVLAGSAAAGPSFVNWENAHVHPLELTPDGAMLLAVNTADNRLQVFDVTSGVPIRVGSIPVGLDPVSVRASGPRQAWVVNHISDTISIVDLDAMNVVSTVDTDDEPADVVFAGVPRVAFVSCSQANTLLAIDPTNPGAPIADLSSLTPGMPISPTDFGTTIRIPINGEDPRTLAVSADGTEVYVAMFESGNKTTIIAGGGALFGANGVNSPLGPYFDPALPFALGTNPPNPPPNDGTSFRPPFNTALPAPPRVGLIVRRDGAGRWMDDNDHDWTDVVSGVNAAASGRLTGWTLLDHDVAVVNTSTFAARYVGGMMNACMAMAVNPGSGRVTIVGTDATNEVRFEPILNGRFLRVNFGSLDPAGPADIRVADLNPHLVYTATIPFAPLPLAERRRAIGDPRGIVWTPDGTRGFVTGMGSNNVVAIDADGLPLSLMPLSVGEGPTGIVFDELRDRLYVLNKFDASISVVASLADVELAPRVSFYDPTPQTIKTGRKHLYDTHRNSGLGHVSCGSCHIDSRIDRLVWDLGNPAGDLKVFNQNCNSNPNISCDDWHPMKGPMATQTLQDIIGKEPHHWRGDRDGLEEFAGAFSGLLGDDAPLPPVDMQEFEAFLATIHFPPNPFRAVDNTLPTNLSLEGHRSTGRFAGAGGLASGAPLPNGNAQNGLQVYRAPFMDGSLACVSCHTLPTGLGADGIFVGGVFQPLPPGANGEHHITVVSSDGSTNRTMKIPHLRNQYEKTGFDTTILQNIGGFGYLHDGSVDSIARFVSLPAFNVVDDQEVADLVAFMLAFSGSDLPAGNPNNPFEPPGPPSLDTHAAVGRQVTVGTPTQPSLDVMIATMISLAEAKAVGLVVKGVQDGEARGYAYIGGGLFQSDRIDEQVDATTLRASAGLGSELTYTVVPLDTQTRIAIDRDEDGFLDRDELDGCSDPADPNSVPPNCLCGGIASIPCANPDEFCKLPVGACCCDQTGICTSTPTGCPDNVDPVCGCDGVTYGNECEADAVGVSVDHLGACVTACSPMQPAQADPTGIAKIRYLSLVAGNPGEKTALQVTLTDLPAPFDTLNGRTLWVGQPRLVSENGSTADPAGAPNSSVFVAASLDCAPFYRDWSQLGRIHIYHWTIIPNGVYDVRVIAEACEIDLVENYSVPLSVQTSGWGDVTSGCEPPGPCGPPDGQVDITTDVVAILNKFASRPTAPIKARVDLEPATPDQVINIGDVVWALDAFGGAAYPFRPQLGPCP